MAKKQASRKPGLEQAVAELRQRFGGHIHLVVYALQDAQAVACMRRVKRMLQQDHVAGQEVVLIEQVPVQFVEADKE